MLIKTKFMGPTYSTGAKVKAMSASGKSVTVAWDHAHGADANHREACIALMQRLVAQGGTEPVQWFMRWDKDGTCVHVGVYANELKEAV